MVGGPAEDACSNREQRPSCGRHGDDLARTPEYSEIGHHDGTVRRRQRIDGLDGRRTGRRHVRLANEDEEQRLGTRARGTRAAELHPVASTLMDAARTAAVRTSVAVPTPIHQRRSKRVLDVVGSLAALIVFAPIILLTALAVYLTDRGPVFFRQVRVGANGREFRMIKFRSMRPDAEEVLHSDAVLYQRYLDNNCKLEAHEDLRITKVGRFIRATSLDEFPQFWNVLRGDMSLVGPRPALPEQDIGHYHDARPGITGLWQVTGRSEVNYHDRIVLDRTYVQEWSLLTDLRILLSTPLAVARRRGAY